MGFYPHIILKREGRDLRRLVVSGEEHCLAKNNNRICHGGRLLVLYLARLFIRTLVFYGSL